MFRIPAVLVLALALASPSLAQTPAASRQPVAATVYELVLNDGSRVYGTIVSEDERQVVFRSRAGAVVTAARSEIASLKQVEGLVLNGEFHRADPNSTRLFFGPTGRSLRRGQTYFGVYEFLMPFVQVGVTDRFSIGGGTPLVFGFDEKHRPFWVTPKLQIHDGATTDLAVGLFHGTTWDGEGGGIAYVVGTHGSAAGSVTAGAGLGYARGGGRAAIVMVGGDKAIGRHVKLVTENYVWTGGTGVASLGVRLFGERLSADVALAVPIGADTFFAFPVVNFVYLF